jgi:hypothetical protein
MRAGGPTSLVTAISPGWLVGARRGPSSFSGCLATSVRRGRHAGRGGVTPGRNFGVLLLSQHLTPSTPDEVFRKSQITKTRAEARKMTTAAPCDETVDAWGARRILDAVARGDTHAQIRHWTATSESTLRRILRHNTSHDEARTPVQGAGKQNDPRWFAAGPNARLNLRVLEEIRAGAPDDEHLRDTYRRLINDPRIIGQPSFSCCKGATRQTLVFLPLPRRCVESFLPDASDARRYPRALAPPHLPDGAR